MNRPRALMRDPYAWGAAPNPDRPGTDPSIDMHQHQRIAYTQAKKKTPHCQPILTLRSIRKILIDFRGHDMPTIRD